MTDKDALAHIHDLVAEEKALRAHDHGPGTEGQVRLAAIEVELDRLWDLLRQRRALRDVGANPDDAIERPAGQVEGYLG